MGFIYRFAIPLGLLVCLTGEQATAADTSAPVVYRCRVDGVLTFADRPCGASAEHQQVATNAVNLSEAPESVAKKPSAKPRTATTKRKTAAAPDRAQQIEKCARLAQSLKNARSKMRAGYTVGEGERLRERQAKLKTEMRIARCS